MDHRKLLIQKVSENHPEVDFVGIQYDHNYDFTEQMETPFCLSRWLDLPFYRSFLLIQYITGDQEIHLFVEDSVDVTRYENLELIKEKYQIDHVYKLSQAEKFLKLMIADAKQVMFEFVSDISSYTSPFSKKIINLILDSKVEVHNFCYIIEETRLTKNENEIELIKKACQITEKAHRKVFNKISPGISESRLSAIFTATCLTSGATKTSYPNMIASGKNSLNPHYSLNDSILESGDLIFIDAAAEYEGYKSDVTRTYPIDGKFTREQSEIYNLVLSVQVGCIEMVKPGVKLDELNRCAILLLAQGLLNLKILKGNMLEIINSKACLAFYTHFIGHFIGLEIHDGSFLEIGDCKLEEGMVITIEPGLYFRNLPDGNKFINQVVAQKYVGIAVRIEDIILVTKDGHQNLTKDIPK